MNLSFICRKRQLRHNSGDTVQFAETRIRAKVVESRWNSRLKCWEYHLEGFPGWVKQSLIK